jgi:hypothetical protein
MKRFSLTLLVLLVLGLPLVVAAQDVKGGAIEDVASSVVLIETLSGRRAMGTGSGTIISPEGYIYTNRHVIEDGDNFAIYMLDDIREQPVLRYYASLVYTSDDYDIDFAILQIDRNRQGRTINAVSERLPYVSPAGTEATIGETIRIYGYPGIGDGYMVVTTGEVVTVQNGSVNGQRLPVWYWTDAEISGGNSGGLAVNADGEWIGLPTWVVSEERTAGRLGGILPLTAAEGKMAADGFSLGDSAPAKPDSFAGGSSGAGSFTLVNASGLAICQVYISPTTATNWGEGRLGGSGIIRAGDSFDFAFDPGLYDVLLQDCAGETLQDVRSVEFDGQTVGTFDGASLQLAVGSDGGPAALTVQNASGGSICYVFISPTTASDWGADQLGAREIIAAGDDRTWELEADSYDVLLQDCGGETLDDLRGIDVFGRETVVFR